MAGGEHEGHRGRMKQRYDKTHFEGFAEHEILEMLLYYTIRQGNTNGTAHEILKRFGNIKNVIHTRPEKLMQIKGVGPESARMLTMLGDLYDTIERGKEPEKINSDTAEKYLLNLFRGKTVEEFYIICLDPMDRILCCKKLSEGSFESVEMNIGDAVRVALDFSSSHVVFAHNHPSGVTQASQADISITGMLEAALFAVGVKMLDHIIVAGDKCISIMSNYKVRKDRSLQGGQR